MAVHYQDVKAVELQPGQERRVIAYDDDIMLVEFTFKAGIKTAPHSHPHNQVSYVKKGRVEYSIGEDLFVLEEVDSIVVPSDALHNAYPVTDAVLLDVFTPVRKDFL